MVNKILTTEQVREAIYQDADFDVEKLEELSIAASSFIKEKTGYDFGADEEKEPLAVLCAKTYVKNIYFSGDGYNKDYDYSFGITGLLLDLQSIADRKLRDAND